MLNFYGVFDAVTEFRRSTTRRSRGVMHSSSCPLGDAAIGIEIGGTKLQSAVVTSAGRVLHRRIDRIDPAAAATGICTSLSAQLAALLAAPLPDGLDLAAVGIGFGGPVDRTRGRVATSFHVAGWGRFPLADWVREQLPDGRASLPVLIENDANAAALGEALVGAGAGSRSVFYTNAGSGIGAGLVIDGVLFHARDRGEMELGHLRLRPGPDILESLASGWALDRRIRDHVQARPAGDLARAAGSAAAASARLLHRAVASGDAAATAILDDAAGHYAHALSHVVHLLDPDVIVLGGGVAEIGAPWRDAVARQLAPLLMETMLPAPPVRLAALGADVVPVGAALAALQAAPPAAPAPPPETLETRR
jgi:glucokinase